MGARDNGANTVTLTGHDEGDVAVAIGVHGYVAALEGGPVIRDEP